MSDDIATAVAAGKAAMLALLNGTEPDEVSSLEFDMFCHAAREGLLGPMRFLMERGVPVEEEDVEGEYHENTSPAIEAVHGGHIEALRLLLEHGAKFTTTDDEDMTAMAVAASKGRLDMVKLMVEHGIDYVTESDVGFAPFQESVDHPEVMRYFLSLGVDASKLLEVAVNKPEVTRLLLDEGAVPDDEAVASAKANYPKTFALYKERGLHEPQRGSACAGVKRAAPDDDSDDDQPPASKKTARDT